MNRYEHVADILLTAELNGFTHAELAALCAVVRRSGDRHADIRTFAAIGDIGERTFGRELIVLH